MYISKLTKISDKNFTEAITSSEFMRDVLEKLGYGRNSGSMVKIIKCRADKLKINYSHLGPGNGKIKVRGQAGIKYKLSDILVKDSNYKSIYRLKKRLFHKGLLKEKCVICGIGNIWNFKKLVLQLDHINGINNDHRLINLRILCPNCHSQTDTFSGKNHK